MNPSGLPDLNPQRLFDKATKTLRRLKEQADRIKAEQKILRQSEHQLAMEAAAGSTRQTIDVSIASVVKATLAVMGLAALAWFLGEISAIIILFFISAFLAIAIDPLVDRLQSFRIPRAISTLGIYIVFIGLLGMVISSFVPILTTEIPVLVTQVLSWINQYFGIDTSLFQEQVNALQTYLGDIQANLNRENISAGLDILGTIGGNALAVFKSVAGGVFAFGLVLVVTFFMVIEEEGIKSFIMALVPRRYHRYVIEKSNAVENKFGSWFRGQLVLMLAMGVITFIALKILGVNYALSLATLAAFAELIPYVGPMIALIPALIIGASQGGIFFAAIILAVYLALQQLEGNVLVPLIMEKAVGLSPVVIMFAMLVGASFPEFINPIVGIILSVPVATAISVFVHDYAEKKK